MMLEHLSLHKKNAQSQKILILLQTTIPEVYKPVHVILCGVKDRISIQHLKLARDIGESVHTLNHDLYDLFKKSESDEVTIMGKKYVIEGGEIVEY